MLGKIIAVVEITAVCISPCGRYKICLFRCSLLYFSEMRLMRNLNVSVTG